MSPQGQVLSAHVAGKVGGAGVRGVVGLGGHGVGGHGVEGQGVGGLGVVGIIVRPDPSDPDEVLPLRHAGV